MLATGSLMVKSVHCALVSHHYHNITVANGQTSYSAAKSDNCAICSFDFFPVVLHSLKVLPDVTPFLYTRLIYSQAETPVQQVSYLYLLRAPPAA
jgi:hypothetical protein